MGVLAQSSADRETHSMIAHSGTGVSLRTLNLTQATPTTVSVARLRLYVHMELNADHIAVH